MKVVLDTNVLIAAFISEGLCHDLFEICFLHHEVVISKGIISEVEKVLQVKFGYDEIETAAVSNLLKRRGRIVAPKCLPEPVCRDPDDDVILGTALAGNCAFVVTGDKDLLDLDLFEGVRIISPTGFLRGAIDVD